MKDERFNEDPIVSTVERLAQRTEAELLAGDDADQLASLLAEVEDQLKEQRAALAECKRRRGADARARDECARLRWGTSRLRTLRRRLQNEVLEARQYERCAQVLGSMASVRALDALVLILIFVVIGMLIVEFSVEGLSETTRAAFDWIDTAICIVFLGEFFFKLWCAPSRAWYWRGHWIDFAASIPLAGIARWGLRWGRLARLARLGRLARFVRVIRAVWFLHSRLSHAVEKNRRVLDQDYEISLDGVRRFLEGLGRADAEHAGEYSELVRAVIAQIENSFLVKLAERVLRFFRLRRRRAAHAGVGAGARLARLVARIQDAITYICDFNGIVTTPQLLHYVGQAMFNAGKRRGIVLLTVGALGALFGLVVQRAFGPATPRLKPQSIDVASLAGPRRISFGQAVCRSRGAKLRLRLINRSQQGPPARIIAISLRDGDVFKIERQPRLPALVKPRKRLNLVVRFAPALPGAADDLLMLRSDDGRSMKLVLSGEGIDPVALRIARRARESFGWNFVLISLPFLGIALVGWTWARKSRRLTADYKTVAEASFLNLMEDAKKFTMFEDLGWLYDEVLRPEAVLQYGWDDVRRRDEEMQRKAEALVEEQRRVSPGYRIEDLAYERRMFPTDGQPGVFTPEELRSTRLGFVLEAMHVITRGYPAASMHNPQAACVIQLYRDYLDGALFHETDRKTIEQLQGNITLRRVARLVGYTRKDYKRIERLSAPFGPNLWLTFIWRSIAEQTGRLVTEFNASCPRLDDVEGETIRGRRDLWTQFQQWLDGGPPVRGDNYFTNHFNAMHFLVSDERQDERVRELFGERVLAKLRRERCRMIRMIFGTYPFKPAVTINPYRLYHRLFGTDARIELHMSRLQRALGVPKALFRFIALPLRMVFWGLRTAAAFARWLRVFILNVLADVEMEQEKPDFDACLRKITRMRGPVIAEATALRGRYDAEYLGCFHHDADASPCVEDLRSVFAAEAVIDYFTSLREERRRDLEQLQEFLARREDLSPEGEALRAAQCAFLVNYRGLKPLVASIPEIERVARAIAENDIVWPKGGRRRSLLWTLKRAFTLGRDAESAAFKRFQELTGAERGPALRVLRKAYVRRVGRVREAIDTFIAADGAPDDRAAEILREVVDNRRQEWTAELITVRTIHALSLLDRRNYEVAVHTLGRFEEVGAPLPERARSAPMVLREIAAV